MKPETAEKLLVWILRGAGVICALAIAPMLMPIAWAQSGYTAIGLGELPGEPIVEYLVRGMSAMCALYGGLLLLLATDVHRGIAGSSLFKPSPFSQRPLAEQSSCTVCPSSGNSSLSTEPVAGFIASPPSGCKAG